MKSLVPKTVQAQLNVASTALAPAVSSNDIDQALNQFKQTIVQISKINQVVKTDDHLKLDALNKNYFNPLQEVNEQASKEKAKVDEVQDITSIEQLDLGNKSAEEKVKILRQYPDILAKFIKDQEMKKKMEKDEQVRKNLEQRLRRQKEATLNLQQQNPDYQPKPLITNFIKYNMKNLGKQHNPVVKMLKSKQKAVLLEIKQQSIQNKLFNNQKLKKTQLVEKLAKPAQDPILPIQFTKQKQKLVSVMHFCANMAFLRNISSVYAELHANNELIRRSAVTIQKFGKRFLMFSVFQQRKSVISVTQTLAKLWLTKKRQQSRISSLQKIQRFLTQQYQFNVYLGSINRFAQFTELLKLQLQEIQQIKETRTFVFQEALKQADLVCTRQKILLQRQADLDDVFNRDKKKKKGQVPDTAVCSDEEVNDACLHVSQQKVFLCVIEQVYKYVKRSKLDLLEFMCQNGYQDLEEAIFEVEAAKCEQILGKALQLGITVNEEGIWEQQPQFVEFMEQLE